MICRLWMDLHLAGRWFPPRERGRPARILVELLPGAGHTVNRPSL